MAPPTAAESAALRRRGVVALTLASCGFGLMATLAKLAAATVPGPEVALVRFVFCTLATGVWALSHRGFRIHNGRALASRGLLGGVAVIAFFVSLSHLSVGVATLLQYTSPIVTALLAALFLGERLAPAIVGALMLTSVGVVLVVHAHAPLGSIGFGPWELVGMLGAVAGGAAVTAMRWARRTDGHWEVFGAFSFFGMLIAAPLSLRSWVWPGSAAWLLLFAVAATSLIAQVLFTWSLRYVTAATAGVVSQLTPTSALVLGVAFLGERPGWAALAGTLCTLVGVAWGAYTEQRAKV